MQIKKAKLLDIISIIVVAMIVAILISAIVFQNVFKNKTQPQEEKPKYEKLEIIPSFEDSPRNLSDKLAKILGNYSYMGENTTNNAFNEFYYTNNLSIGVRTPQQYPYLGRIYSIEYNRILKNVSGNISKEDAVNILRKVLIDFGIPNATNIEINAEFIENTWEVRTIVKYKGYNVSLPHAYSYIYPPTNTTPYFHEFGNIFAWIDLSKDIEFKISEKSAIEIAKKQFYEEEEKEKRENATLSVDGLSIDIDGTIAYIIGIDYKYNYSSGINHYLVDVQTGDIIGSGSWIA